MTAGAAILAANGLLLWWTVGLCFAAAWHWKRLRPAPLPVFAGQVACCLVGLAANGAYLLFAPGQLPAATIGVAASQVIWGVALIGASYMLTSEYVRTSIGDDQRGV